MVVMEEAACFGSQAEVPGTRGRGAGGGENGRSEENRPVKATLTVREERTGAGEELLGLGLALSRCERQHPQTLESPASVGCNLPPKAKQPAPPAPPPRPAPPLRPGVFRSREKRAPITKSEIRTQKWGGGGGADLVSLGRNNAGGSTTSLGESPRSCAREGVF